MNQFTDSEGKPQVVSEKILGTSKNLQYEAGKSVKLKRAKLSLDYALCRLQPMYSRRGSLSSLGLLTPTGNSFFLKKNDLDKRIILSLTRSASDIFFFPGLLHPFVPVISLLLPFTMTKLSNGDEDAFPSKSSQARDLVLIKSVKNLNELETMATKNLSEKAWSFNYAAAGDLISRKLDQEVYRSILLRPRVLINVKECNISTTIIDQKVGLPVFISPIAMAGLAHPTGEAGISAGCAAFGAMHIISNNASMVPEQIVAGAPPEQVFGFQLYIQTDRIESEVVLKRVNKIPAIKCIVLTVDEPVPGKHELGPRGSNPYYDIQTQDQSQLEERLSANKDAKVALPSVSSPASDIEWDTELEWLTKRTSLPIIIKGIQTYEDVQIACKYAPRVKGIILSNHGGRVIDTASPAIHTLLEVRRYCPDAFEKLEVMVDGGIRRGTDVVKALCLGARAVGVGRPAFWGLGAGGVAGVERTLESEYFICYFLKRGNADSMPISKVLAEETKTCMQLLGVRRLADLRMHHVSLLWSPRFFGTTCY